MIDRIKPATISWILARRTELAGASVRLDASKLPEALRALVADAELLHPFIAGDSVVAMLNVEYVRAAWEAIRSSSDLIDDMAVHVRGTPPVEWTAMCSLRDILDEARSLHSIE